MASLLLNKAEKMKQRLRKSLALAGGGLSCSSAASTSVAAITDRHPRRSRPIAAPSSLPNKPSNTKMMKKKTVTTSPASSSRFLLNSSRLQPPEQSDGDITVIDSLPPEPSSFIDFFPVVTDQQIAKPSSSSSSSTQEAKDDDDRQRQQQQQAVIVKRCCSARRRSEEQVVVLKVSLHCKGCAGKVRKHISKMEGVTSLDIDIATKKVTVVGDVTPLGVLNCISKVKSAQFWPDQPRRASMSS